MEFKEEDTNLDSANQDTMQTNFSNEQDESIETFTPPSKEQTKLDSSFSKNNNLFVNRYVTYSSVNVQNIMNQAFEDYLTTLAHHKRVNTETTKTNLDMTFSVWFKQINSYIENNLAIDLARFDSKQVKKQSAENIEKILQFFFNKFLKNPPNYLDNFSEIFFPNRDRNAHESTLQFLKMKDFYDRDIKAKHPEDEENIIALEKHIMHCFYILLCRERLHISEQEAIVFIQHTNHLIRTLDSAKYAHFFSPGNKFLQNLGKVLMLIGIAIAVAAAAPAIASWFGFALPAVMASWLLTLQSMVWVQQAVAVLPNFALSMPVSLAVAGGVTLFGKAVEMSGGPTKLRRQAEQVSADLEKAAVQLFKSSSPSP